MTSLRAKRSNLFGVASAFGLAMTVNCFAAGVSLHRACTVQAEPKQTGAPVCRARSGTAVDAITKSAPGYYYVKIGPCTGYLSSSCVQLPAGAPARPPASLREPTPADQMTLGISGTFDFSRATVSYEDTWSRGMAFSGGIQLQIPINDFRIATTVQYAKLLIARDLDGSGAIENPSPTTFSQSLDYVGLQLLVGMKVDDAPAYGEPDIWAEAGLEYMHPIGASQSIGEAASEAFTNTDKPLLVLAGMGADFPLGGNTLLGTRVQLFYNLSSTAGSKYFGARLAVAMSLGL